MVQLASLRERLPEPLTKEQEKKLLAMLPGENGKQARELLILHNLRLVRYTAGQYYDRGNVFRRKEISFEDLVAEGAIGLIRAADTFDQKRAVRFGTYAGRCIYHEMQMYVRRQRYIGREYPGGVSGLWEGRTEEAAEEKALARLEREQRSSVIRRAIRGLSREEQQLLRLRYGDKEKPRMTQEQTAAVLGISQSYLSRMERRTLRKLRHAVEAACGA